MLTISIPFGSWGIVSRRFIRDFIIKDIHLPLLFKGNPQISRPIEEVCPLSFSFSRTDHRVNVDVLFDAISLHTKLCKAFNK